MTPSPYFFCNLRSCIKRQGSRRVIRRFDCARSSRYCMSSAIALTLWFSYLPRRPIWRGHFWGLPPHSHSGAQRQPTSSSNLPPHPLPSAGSLAQRDVRVVFSLFSHYALVASATSVWSSNHAWTHAPKARCTLGTCSLAALLERRYMPLPQFEGPDAAEC